VVGKKRLAEIVPIKPPRICRPVRDHLENLFYWMPAPDAATQFYALAAGSARLADHGEGGDAVPPVKPAIGSPRKAIHHVVAGFERPAIENDLRRAVG